MIRINLLPAREAKRRIVLRNQLQLTALLVSLACLGAMWLTYLQQQEHTKRVSTLERIEADINALDHIVKEVEAFQARRDQLQKQIEVLNGLKQNQRSPAPVMDALSRSLPEQVWLSRVQEKGGGVQITGKSLNGNVGIATFMENMSRSPWFGTAELVESKSETFRNRSVVSFTVMIPITIPKAKQATS